LFEYTTIDQYHLALTQGNTSCTEVVHYYLSKIEKSKHLNAFIHVFADEAIQKASALDERRKAGKAIGKLHGVVIIKDVIVIKIIRIRIWLLKILFLYSVTISYLGRSQIRFVIAIIWLRMKIRSGRVST
jgi:hypothetical protein